MLCVQLQLSHSALFTPLRREPRKENKPAKKGPGESDAEGGSEAPRKDAKAQAADARGAHAAAEESAARAKGARDAGAAGALPVPAAGALTSSADLELHSELFDWCSKQFLAPLLSVPAANDPESLANRMRRARYQFNAHVDELGVSECASISKRSLLYTRIYYVHSTVRLLLLVSILIFSSYSYIAGNKISTTEIYSFNTTEKPDFVLFHRYEQQLLIANKASSKVR